MSCQHCARAVAQALEAVPGVKRARVDLKEGVASVDCEAEPAAADALEAAVREAGYEAKVSG